MRTARALLVFLAAVSALSPMSHAQELIDRRAKREYRAAQASISLDQAVKMAQNRYQSKAVKAETVDEGGRRVHRIRLLSAEGMVRTVHVDAQTGAMR
jgi:uncharacterized membrane protein YkoI